MPETLFFSIIIPTHNRADLIGKTIQSFLNQTFENFEIIVIDNDSKDNTEEIVRNFNDKRISYFKKKNEEQAIARNFGAKRAKGEYFNFFDSDDIAYTNHLQTAYNFIQTKKGVEIFHQDFELKNPEGEIIDGHTSIYNINEQLPNGNVLSINGVFLNRGVALEYPFNEDRKIIGSEDYLLWLKLSSLYKIQNIPIYTSASIQHAKRAVLNFTKEKLIERKERMLIYILGDNSIAKHYKKKMGRLKATAYFYVALHLIMLRKRRWSIKYLIKGIKWSPSLIFTKRFLVIVKYFLK